MEYGIKVGLYQICIFTRESSYAFSVS